MTKLNSSPSVREGFYIAALSSLSAALFIFSLVFSTHSQAASCCGGGASSGVILPKFNQAMWDVSLAQKNDKGSWQQDGDHNQTTTGNESLQQNINLNYAHRLNDNWQMSYGLPLTSNQNQNSGKTYSNFAIGDFTIGTWYEAFENVTCVYKITGLESLKPAVYFGSSLTLPTGISAYSDDATEFNTTGAGVYRLDANMLIEKTVYPFSLSWQASYGEHLDRPVYQRYGSEIPRYNLQLGTQTSHTLSFAYTHFLPNLSMLSVTTTLTNVEQKASQINGQDDTATGFDKNTLGLNLSFFNGSREWNIKFNNSLDFGGNNTAKYFTSSIGVSRVY